MKTIIAGSRDGVSLKDVEKAVAECGWKITGVVCGCARGADTAGETIGIRMNVPIYKYPADWNKYGRAAGLIRNTQMAENAEALIAVWDGRSRGTQNMIRTAKAKGLKVFVHHVRELEIEP